MCLVLDLSSGHTSCLTTAPSAHHALHTCLFWKRHQQPNSSPHSATAPPTWLRSRINWTVEGTQTLSTHWMISAQRWGCSPDIFLARLLSLHSFIHQHKFIHVSEHMRQGQPHCCFSSTISCHLLSLFSFCFLLQLHAVECSTCMLRQGKTTIV